MGVPPPDPPTLKSVSECEEPQGEKLSNGNLQIPIVSKTNGCTLRDLARDQESTADSIQPARRCPLVSLGSELDIEPGQASPSPSSAACGSLASLADINNVYCNTGRPANQNDIALTFQEIESQAASVQHPSNRGLTESLSR